MTYQPKHLQPKIQFNNRDAYMSRTLLKKRKPRMTWRLLLVTPWRWCLLGRLDNKTISSPARLLQTILLPMASCKFPGLMHVMCSFWKCNQRRRDLLYQLVGRRDRRWKAMHQGLCSRRYQHKNANHIVAGKKQEKLFPNNQLLFELQTKFSFFSLPHATTLVKIILYCPFGFAMDSWDVMPLSLQLRTVMEMEIVRQVVSFLSNESLNASCKDDCLKVHISSCTRVKR